MLSSKSLERSAERVSALAHRGVDSVRDTTRHLRERAHRTSDQTVNYIRDDPVKAILIAAAAATAVMAVLSLFSHARGRR